jgi:hypothetical protein
LTLIAINADGIISILHMIYGANLLLYVGGAVLEVNSKSTFIGIKIERS